MSAGNLNPDGTVLPDASVVTGAASAHAATSDTSDASYVNKTAGTNPVRFTLQNPTKPGGSILRKLTLNIKASSQSSARVYWDVWGTYDGRTRFGQTQFSLTGTTATFFFGGDAIVGDLAAADLNNLQIHAQVPSFSAGNGRLHEVWLYYEFAEIPSVNVDSPTTTQSVSDVEITWTHTPGANGGLQSVYIVKVFSLAQYTAQGFNPDTSIASWNSGVVPSQSQQATAVGLTTGTYRAYVKTAQNVNSTSQYGAWDYTQFDVSLTTAEVETVTVGADSDEGRLEILVMRDLAEDAWSSVDLQRNYDYSLFDIGQFEAGSGGVGTGWNVITSAGTPTSTSQSLQTTGGKPNQYQRFVATLDNGDKRSLETIAHYPGFAFIATRVFAYIKGTLGTGCELNVVVNYFDALGVYLSSTWETVSVTSTWKPWWSEFYAPAGTREVQVAFEMAGGASASSSVCTVDVDGVLAYAGGSGWNTVPYTPGITPGADDITYYDYDAPPDRLVRYRARAVKTTGNIAGAWVYDEEPFSSWTMTFGVWIKSLTDFRKNIQLMMTVAPDVDYDERRGVFDILGSSDRTVVSDARSMRSLPVKFLTEDDTQMAAFLALIQEETVLIQPAAFYRIAPGYFSLGKVTEGRPVRIAHSAYRVWVANDALEVPAP
jgi:hypothetical protein